MLMMHPKKKESRYLYHTNLYKNQPGLSPTHIIGCDDIYDLVGVQRLLTNHTIETAASFRHFTFSSSGVGYTSRLGYAFTNLSIEIDRDVFVRNTRQDGACNIVSFERLVQHKRSHCYE